MVQVSEEQQLERRIAQYDREVSELRGQVKLLEDELALSRRKLEAAPRQIHLLEKRLSEASAHLDAAQERWRRFNGHELVADVLAGVKFKAGEHVTDEETTTAEKVAA